ncbi:MAG: beta-lactam-binding protein with PASTA domain [Maribacter sp.]|jgi:beta-lactam-binding protein with PASTA domain
MNETDNTNRPSFFKRLFIFGSTPRVLLNFLGMTLATLLALWMTFGLLKCYTRHNKTFEVPNFMEMKVANVKADGDSSRFNFEYSKSAYNRFGAKGVIISQDPPAQTRAKSGRTIYLTYTPDQPPLREIPRNLYGLKLQYATSDINQSFVHKVVKTVIDPSAPGTVIEVRYKGKVIESKKLNKKTMAMVGDTIELVVSEEYNGGSTQVPDLVCLTYAEALFKLRNGHNLMLGSVTLDATVTDTTSAYIVGQYPFYASGEFIGIGSQIDLRLSQQKPPECDGSEYGDYDSNNGRGDAVPPVDNSDQGTDDDASDDTGF